MRREASTAAPVASIDLTKGETALTKKPLEEKLANLMVELETNQGADTKELVTSFWSTLSNEERAKVRDTLPEIAKLAHGTELPALPPAKPATVACTLRIQNLSPNTKAQQLGAVFGQYKVVAVNLFKAKHTDSLVGVVKLAHKPDQRIDGEQVRQEMDG